LKSVLNNILLDFHNHLNNAIISPESIYKDVDIFSVGIMFDRMISLFMKIIEDYITQLKDSIKIAIISMTEFTTINVSLENLRHNIIADSSVSGEGLNKKNIN